MEKPAKPIEFYGLTMLGFAYSAFFVFLCFGDVESPMSNWTPYIVSYFSNKLGFKESSGRMEYIQNVIVHLTVWMTIMFVVVKFKERAWYGSFKAANEAYELERKQAAFKTSIGSVQRVHVDRGGLFDNTISTIETETGIFRVNGDVGSVHKGTPIMRTQEQLYVGFSSDKGYTFI